MIRIFVYIFLFSKITFNNGDEIVSNNRYFSYLCNFGESYFMAIRLFYVNKLDFAIKSNLNSENFK